MILETVKRIMVNEIRLATYMIAFGALVKSIYISRYFPTKTAGRFIVEDFINYYVASILMIQTSEYIYYECSEKIGLEGIAKVLLTAGFFLTLILICSGKITELFYIFVRSKEYKVLRKEFPERFPEMNLNEKTYIICWSCIATIIMSLMFNYMISVYAIAIFLGRFVWFDSIIGKESFTIKDFFKDIFVPMNDQNKKINGSIIKIRNMVLIGSVGYIFVVILLNYCFSNKVFLF